MNAEGTEAAQASGVDWDQAVTELENVPEKFKSARFDPGEQVVELLNSQDPELEVQKLRDARYRVEGVVDSVVDSYHNGFNKAIQFYSQILRLFTNSQSLVATLRGDMADARRGAVARNSGLQQQWRRSITLSNTLRILTQVEEATKVPAQLQRHVDAREYKAACILLQDTVALIGRDELRMVGAIRSLVQELAEWKDTLTELLVDEALALLFPPLPPSLVPHTAFPDFTRADAAAPLPADSASDPLNLLTPSHLKPGQGGSGVGGCAAAPPGEPSPAGEAPPSSSAAPPTSTRSKRGHKRGGSWGSDPSLTSLPTVLPLAEQGAEAGSSGAGGGRPSDGRQQRRQASARRALEHMRGAVEGLQRVERAGVLRRALAERTREELRALHLRTARALHSAPDPTARPLRPPALLAATTMDTASNLWREEAASASAFLHHLFSTSLQVLEWLVAVEGMMASASAGAAEGREPASAGSLAEELWEVMLEECEAVLADMLRGPPPSRYSKASASGSAGGGAAAPSSLGGSGAGGGAGGEAVEFKFERSSAVQRAARLLEAVNAAEGEAGGTGEGAKGSAVGESRGQGRGRAGVEGGWRGRHGGRGRRAAGAGSGAAPMAALVPRGGPYLAPALYRPVLEFLRSARLTLPSASKDTLEGYLSKYATTQFLPRAKADILACISEALSTPDARRPLPTAAIPSHATAGQALAAAAMQGLEGGRGAVLPVVPVVEAALSDVLHWALAMPPLAGEASSIMQDTVQCVLVTFRHTLAEVTAASTSASIVACRGPPGGGGASTTSGSAAPPAAPAPTPAAPSFMDKLARSVSTGTGVRPAGPSQDPPPTAVPAAPGAAWARGRGAMEVVGLAMERGQVGAADLVADAGWLAALAALGDSAEALARALRLRLAALPPAGPAPAPAPEEQAGAGSRGPDAVSAGCEEVAGECAEVLRAELQLHAAVDLRRLVPAPASGGQGAAALQAPEAEEFTGALVQLLDWAEAALPAHMLPCRRDHVLGGVAAVIPPALRTLLGQVGEVGGAALAAVERLLAAAKRTLAARPSTARPFRAEGCHEQFTAAETYFRLLHAPPDEVLQYIAKHPLQYTASEYRALLSVSHPPRGQVTAHHHALLEKMLADNV